MDELIDWYFVKSEIKKKNHVVCKFGTSFRQLNKTSVSIVSLYWIY